jgi:outer membrane protein assembly factor BamE (lipoprotein component of BamABCDE complex)
MLLLLYLSSCIILPMPNFRLTGRVFIKPATIQFIRQDTTQREEILLKLGDPEAVAMDDHVFIYRWEEEKAVVAIYEIGGTTISVRKYFMVAFNDDNTVKKMEIFNYNIQHKQPLQNFIPKWYAAAATKPPQ